MTVGQIMIMALLRYVDLPVDAIWFAAAVYIQELRLEVLCQQNVR